LELQPIASKSEKSQELGKLSKQEPKKVQVNQIKIQFKDEKTQVVSEIQHNKRKTQIKRMISTDTQPFVILLHSKWGCTLINFPFS